MEYIGIKVSSETKRELEQKAKTLDLGVGPFLRMLGKQYKVGEAPTSGKNSGAPGSTGNEAEVPNEQVQRE